MQVLGFIGIQLIGEYLGYKISEIASLGVVASMMSIGIALKIKNKIKNTD